MLFFRFSKVGGRGTLAKKESKRESKKNKRKTKHESHTGQNH